MARKQLDFLLTSFLDSNGNPLTGGKIHVYQAGTTTEENTYTVISGGSVQTQPITLDTNGIKKLYVGGANNIRVVIKDSTDTTTLYDFDDLEVKPLNGYLPLSAGSGQALTGDLYGGGFDIRNFSNAVIGTDVSPDGTFHVHTASAGSVNAHANANDVVIESNDHTGMTLLSPNNKSCSFFFGDADDNDVGGFIYDHTLDQFKMLTGATTDYIFFKDGRIGINTDAAPTSERLRLSRHQNASVGGSLDNTALLVLEDDDPTSHIQFLAGSGATTNQGVFFGDDDSDNGALIYVHGTTPTLTLRVNGGSSFVMSNDTLNTVATTNYGFNTTSFGASSKGVIAILNANTVPTGNPTGGGVLYCEAGALKYRGSGGTTTTIAAA